MIESRYKAQNCFISAFCIILVKISGDLKVCLLTQGREQNMVYINVKILLYEVLYFT